MAYRRLLLARNLPQGGPVRIRRAAIEFDSPVV